MAELLVELYSEEIPPQLQIGVRNQLKSILEKSFEEKNIKHKDINIYSSPTRLSLLIKDLPNIIKIASQEIKGPKVGSSNDIIEGFTKAKNILKKDLFEKITDKGKFYFIKIESKNILVETLLKEILLKALTSINWKKSMKWSNYNLMWGGHLDQYCQYLMAKNYPLSLII